LFDSTFGKIELKLVAVALRYIIKPKEYSNAVPWSEK